MWNLPPEEPLERPLDWVIVGVVGQQYGSFTLLCKTVQYARVLLERRGLTSRVVHRLELSKAKCVSLEARVAELDSEAKVRY